MKKEKLSYIKSRIKNYVKELIIGYKDMFNDLSNKEFKKHIPNMITTARIGLGVASFTMMILNMYTLAVPMFAIGALTDCVDGFVARKFNLKSVFGAKLDAFADKLFVLGPTIILGIQNPIILPLLLGEAVIVGINTRSYVNKVPVVSSKCGKIKTIFLFLTLSTELLSKLIPTPTIEVFRNMLMLSTMLFQISTAVGYDETFNTAFQSKDNIKIELVELENKDCGDEENQLTSQVSRDITELEQFAKQFSDNEGLLETEPNKTRKMNDI